MKFKLLLELEEKHEFPDWKEKSLKFFVIFRYLHLSMIFGGNNPHYPTIIENQNKSCGVICYC